MDMGLISGPVTKIPPTCHAVQPKRKRKKILASEIDKELLKLNNKIIQCFKWAKDLNRHFTRKDTRMANDHE